MLCSKSDSNVQLCKEEKWHMSTKCQRVDDRNVGLFMLSSSYYRAREKTVEHSGNLGVSDNVQKRYCCM